MLGPLLVAGGLDRMKRKPSDFRLGRFRFARDAVSASFSLLMACMLAPPALERPPHFAGEILPVLTKAGCNAGSCHGAAAGRGGFHLSLWGSDPSADYAAIVEEFEGRRINLVFPAESLIFRKPSGQIGHEGGVPLPEDSLGAARLLRWIAAGAPRGDPRSLREFVVSPESQVVKLGQAIPLRAARRSPRNPRRMSPLGRFGNPPIPAQLRLIPKPRPSPFIARGNTS